MKILEDYNKTNYTKVDSLIIYLQSNSNKDVRVSDVDIIPAVGKKEQILPDLYGMIENLKRYIPPFFEKYPETINNMPAGNYTATYKIPLPKQDDKTAIR